MTDYRPPTEDLSSPDDLLDEAVAEIGQRMLAGHIVDVEEIIRRFPDREQQIRQLLPAIQALAGLDESSVFGHSDQSARQHLPSIRAKHVGGVPPSALRRASRWLLRHPLVAAAMVGLAIVVPTVGITTYRSIARMPADSQSKGDAMKSSTAAKVATVVAAVSMLTSDAAQAGKPPKPPSPPSPPVTYQLTWIDAADPDEFKVTFLFGLNSQGMAVGQGFETYYGGSTPSSALLWTPLGLQHLDDVSFVWTDVVNGDVEEGWSATVARRINEQGHIVGTAIQNGDPASGRAFWFDVFDPTAGFHLLPNPPEGGEPCRYAGCAINEFREVIGIYYVNAEYARWRWFFWTPDNPSAIQPLPEGEYCDSNTKMNDTYFASYVSEGANANNGLDWKLYSYSVPGGVFTPSLHKQFTAVQLGDINSNNVLPFIAKTVKGRKTTYNLCLYNANTLQTTTLAPSYWNGVGNVNASGDVMFAGPDGIMRIYRNLEQTAYKIYDLLDAASKAELDQATSVALPSLRVNDSDVALVPQSDPFDHIAGYALFTIGTKSYPRGFVLTPVAK